jgi:DNA-binding response OmpR family regulator
LNKISHIAVVDDELDIRETLQEYLELHGYRVTCADGGPKFRQIVSDEDIDLAILDISMPGEDGLSLARFLRENTDIAIIMLSAKNDIIDRIVGIEVGADDYLAKPVDLRELLARVSAVLSRYGLATQPGKIKPTPENRIQIGECQLDPDSQQLFNAGGTLIKITALEFELLKIFAERPNRVLSRDQLFNLAYDREWDPFDRSIDIRIGRLRRKIEKDPAKPQIIKTVHGAGYIFSTG